MKICEKCNSNFPSTVVIDGKRRNLKNRKYCLTCSPFGVHNTKKLDGSLRKDQVNNRGRAFRCKCGESDRSKFYGDKGSICGKCHNKYTIRRGKEKRIKAIKYLGGKCIGCGYDKYYGAIDLHHLDPSKKDINFSSLRGWSWDRIVKEINNCVPLCRTCHAEVHGGIRSIG